MADWHDVVSHLDVVALYNAYGVELRRVPSKARCPFHDDRTASMSVSAEGLFNCFACDEKGSAFDFIMKRGGATSFAEAVDVAATYSGSSKVVPFTPRRTLDPNRIQEWMHALINNVQVQAYLTITRGITSETAVLWQLGWTGDRISIPIGDNAKLYKPNATGGDKMVWAVGGAVSILWPSSTLVGERIVLVEGEFDCMLMRQHGFDAYTGTAGAGTWKEEWSHAFTNKTVFILYDHDLAGREGATKAAASLHRAGAKVFIASWPDDVAEGFDCTDWFNSAGGTAEELRALLGRAVPYEPVAKPAAAAEPPQPDKGQDVLVPMGFEDAAPMVALIDPATTPTELLRIFRSWYPSLTKWSTAEVKLLYQDVITSHFGKTLNRNHLRTLEQDALDHRRKAERAARAGHAPGTALTVHGESDEYLLADFKHMDLGQAWLNDKLYYTVTRGVITKELTPDYQWVEKPSFQPVFISEEGLMLADVTEMAKEKFYLNGVKPHVNFNESWTSDPREKHSWGWYLKHRDERVDLRPLYHDVRDVFSRYLYVGDEPMYDVLALYTMLSYVYRVFRSVGYMWFRALRGSGKSRTLDIFQCLGFNALKLIDPSDAFMYRRMAATSPLVLIDEAEDMAGEQKASLRKILRMGYIAGTGIGRAKVEDKEITEVQFDVYGPKVLASIADPDPTTADRCIVYDMERSPRNLPDFNNDRMNPKWVMLRNRLHCFGLQYARDVRDRAAELAVDEEGVPVSPWADEVGSALRNRDRQVWTPLLALARLIDGDDEAAPLFHKVVGYGQQYVVSKSDAVVEDSEFIAVMAVRRYVRDHGTLDEWYSATEMLKYIRSVEGLSERFSAKRLASMLMHKLKLVGKLEHAQRGAKSTVHYFLPLDRLEAKCRSLMLPEEDMLSFRESDIVYVNSPGQTTTPED